MMDINLAGLQLMEAEHEAWLRAGHEFKELGLDINDEKYDPLMRALERWGEELAALRIEQAKGQAELVQKVLAEKRERAEASATPGWAPLHQRDEGWKSIPPLNADEG